MIKPITSISFLLLMAMIIGGCISPNDETDAPYVLHIRTSFVPDESHDGAMVPDGVPAAGVRLFIGPRTPIEVDGDEQVQEWEFDPPCPRELTEPHQVVRHRCEDHPRLTDVVLPPIATDDFHGERRLRYPLNSDGEIRFHSYEPFTARISLAGPYNEELMDFLIQPDDECEPYLNQPWDGGYQDARGIEAKVSGRGVIIDFSGVGEITLLWAGYCREDDEGTAD